MVNLAVPKHTQRQVLEFMGINAERILNFVETGVDSGNPTAEKSLSKI